MTTEVISVKPETTVGETARLLTSRRISGVPVVDGGGRVVGFVAEDDLFLKEKGIPFSLVKAPALFDRWVNPDCLPEIYENSRHYKAADVMTPRVVTIDEQETVGALARLMVERDVKKLPVTSGGKLVGIVSRADLVRLLADG